jgi:hypothetical protein
VIYGFWLLDVNVEATVYWWCLESKGLVVFLFKEIFFFSWYVTDANNYFNFLCFVAEYNICFYLINKCISYKVFGILTLIGWIALPYVWMREMEGE